MPIYEYACKGCNERFEELVSTPGEKPVACPHCGSTKNERLYTTFATEWKPSIVNWHRMPTSPW